MIQIRIATENDLEAMLEIYNDVIVNTTAVYDYEPHTLEMRRQWFRIKEAQGYPVFVAEENGRIVGFSSIGPFRAWAAYKYSVENSVYVAADQRGKGIGKKLIEPLITAAEELNMQEVATIFSEALNKKITYNKLPGLITRLFMGKDLYKMFSWINNNDAVFLKDMAAFKKQFPHLLDLKTWIKQKFTN